MFITERDNDQIKCGSAKRELVKRISVLYNLAVLMEKDPNLHSPHEELLWQDKCLTIPNVNLSKDFIKLHRNRSGKVVARIIGVGECEEKWILARLSSSVDEAKQFIKEEIDNDLRSMYTQNGQCYLNVEGFAQYLRYGLLPKDVRDYLKEGITHLGLGPGIIALKEGKYRKFYMDNLLGIWRPLQDINF